MHKTYEWLHKNYLFVIFVVLMAIAANLFLYQFYHSERFVYFWDSSFYEFRFAYITNKFRLNFGAFRALRSLLGSIAFTDHSLIAPFVITPLGLLFGTGRKVFLFSVLNVFGLPAALSLGVVFLRLIDNKKDYQWLPALLPVSLMLFAPQFWIPITLGFYDISTLIVVCALWLILLSNWQNKSIAKAILMGTLLALLVLIRRWFAYWAVSLFPALFIIWLFRKATNQQILFGFKLILICGIAAGLVFITFAAPVAYQMLTNNYGDMFSAYKLGLPTSGIMLNALEHYGWISILFAGAGYIFALKDNRTKLFSQIIGLQSLIALFLFARVQRVAEHHQYQLLIVIILFQSLFLFCLWKTQTSAPLKWLMSGVFVITALMNFLQGLVPQFDLHVQYASLFAEAKHYPLTRSDSQQIKQLIYYLDKETLETFKIYVAASSATFNDDILRNACLYLQLPNSNPCSRILDGYHVDLVDLRDGFPQQLLQADFMVVGDPVQYHLNPRDQSVVGIPALMLLENEGIGKAYQQLPQKFVLENGVVVKIFKKIRNPKPEEKQLLNREFVKLYPRRESLFQAQ
jgi:hypothetical protein